jgi:hypothetical protein
MMLQTFKSCSGAAVTGTVRRPTPSVSPEAHLSYVVLGERLVAQSKNSV